MKNHQNWRERSHDITAKIVEDYSFANINEAYKILESFIEKLLKEKETKTINEFLNHERCSTCGKPMNQYENKGLSDMCGKCFEEA